MPDSTPKGQFAKGHPVLLTWAQAMSAQVLSMSELQVQVAPLSLTP